MTTLHHHSEENVCQSSRIASQVKDDLNDVDVASSHRNAHGTVEIMNPHGVMSVGDALQPPQVTVDYLGVS